MNTDTSKLVTLDIFSDLYISSPTIKDINARITVKQTISKDIECSLEIVYPVNLFSIEPIDDNNVTVLINQTDSNQTIHVYTPQKLNGEDHIKSFVTLRDTEFEAEIIPNKGYIAGDLICEKISDSDTVNKIYKDINSSVSIYYNKYADIECDCTVEIERRKSYVYFF